MQKKREVSRENSKELINQAIIKGRVAEELKFDHEMFGEKLYATRIAVKRKSETEDMIPIIVSERRLSPEFLSEKLTGKMVEIQGEFRSYDKSGKDEKSHLKLYLLGKKVVFREACDDDDNNEILLRGYLCKIPIYRSARRSNRKITDLLIAVNRRNKKSSYIPCIAWGRNAKRASLMETGDCIELKGRIQSRKYFKKDSSNPEDGELREAYEISISDIDLIEE